LVSNHTTATATTTGLTVRAGSLTTTATAAYHKDIDTRYPHGDRPTCRSHRAEGDRSVRNNLTPQTKRDLLKGDKRGAYRHRARDQE